MKKILAMLLAAVMVLGLAACGGSSAPAATEAPAAQAPAATEAPAAQAPAATEAPAAPEAVTNADDIPDEMTSADGKYQIAFVTDVGQLKDKSFNQGTYDGVKLYAANAGKSYKYYQPAGGDQATDDDRYDAMKLAAENGAEVIVCAGFMQGTALAQAAAEFTDVKFVFIDGWALGMNNVAGICFQEEQCGYLAGYAAVMEGYTKLGFCGGGGGTNAACDRYGYGFVQGADAAATELEKTDKVTMKYAYGNQFYGDADITAVMDTWYADGTEIVFACGGGIYTSAVEAANIHGAKVVGVDVDQSYIDACIVTSAMKGLQNVTETILGALEAGEWDATYGGKFITYSLSEGDYVGIPTAESSWRFNNFTMEQYEAVHAKLMSGEIVVDNNSDNPTPEIDGIAVTYVD